MPRWIARQIVLITTIFGFLFASALLCGCSDAVAPDEPSCANPRSATLSMLDWLQPGVYDANKAITCVDAPTGRDARKLAVQLKQVLDSRGHYVYASQIPEDPNFADESGKHRVVPVEDFPALVIVRQADGQWVYSETTMERVPGLYEQTFSDLSLWFQKRLPPVFFTPFGGIYLWQYLFGVLLVLIAWLAGQVVKVLLRGQVRKLVGQLDLPLDEETYAKTNGPLVLLTMIAVVMWGLPDLQLNVHLSSRLHTMGWLLAVLAGVTAAMRFMDVFGAIGRDIAMKSESKLDDQLVPLLHQAARTVLWAMAVVLVLDAMGVDVWKLAAGVGIGGLAFALAAQDTVANFFGSVNIFLDKPFQIGDAVQIGDVGGVIEEVGFRSTRVRTYTNSVVTIPNSKITNANVDNLGKRNRRRQKYTLAVTYDTPPDKLQAFVTGIRAILAAHPMVDRSYEVHFYNLGESALEILVAYHLNVPGWHDELRTRSENLLEIMRLAERMAIQFAFPSTSVYVEATPDHPLTRAELKSLDELEQVASGFGPGGPDARPEGPPLSRTWTVQERAARGELEE